MCFNGSQYTHIHLYMHRDTPSFDCIAITNLYSTNWNKKAQKLQSAEDLKNVGTKEIHNFLFTAMIPEVLSVEVFRIRTLCNNAEGTCCASTGTITKYDGFNIILILQDCKIG